jgi:hypothetical protein
MPQSFNDMCALMAQFGAATQQEIKGIYNQIELTEARVMRVENHTNSGPLTVDELTELHNLIAARYDELGYLCTYGTKQKPQGTVRFILKAIKEEFLPGLHASQVTHKNIPSREFDRVKDFVRQWVPNGKQRPHVTKKPRILTAKEIQDECN